MTEERPRVGHDSRGVVWERTIMSEIRSFADHAGFDSSTQCLRARLATADGSRLDRCETLPGS